MELRDYRKSQGWTLADVADLIRTDTLLITESLVRKHEEGIHIPRPEVIERYTKLSGGKVTAESFYAARKRRQQELRKAKSGGDKPQRATA